MPVDNNTVSSAGNRPDSRSDGQLNGRLDNRLASDSFSFPHALGVIDGAGRTTFSYGNTQEIYPYMSVTKLLVAWATLIAVERGLADFDDPAGPPGSTVVHLLAHASGLPEEEGPARAGVEEKRIYSNYGFEVLGDYLEKRTGILIQNWVRQVVIEPLRLSSVAVEASPAYSAVGNLRDLARFAGELLRPRLISTGLARYATTVHFDGLPGLLPGYGWQRNNTWGLGMEIRGEKDPHWTGPSFSPRTFGHFGQSGSFLWVDPELGKAGVFLGAQPFGREHRKFWPALTEEMRGL
ncbi:serine hydrolase domain-containing protein [Actinotignum schaalii]